MQNTCDFQMRPSPFLKTRTVSLSSSMRNNFSKVSVASFPNFEDDASKSDPHLGTYLYPSRMGSNIQSCNNAGK